MTLFQTATVEDGRIKPTFTMTADLHNMDSPDPIAFSYGYMQGMAGQKRSKGFRTGIPQSDTNRSGKRQFLS